MAITLWKNKFYNAGESDLKANTKGTAIAEIRKEKSFVRDATLQASLDRSLQANTIGVADYANVSQLQLIRLLTKVGGKPSEQFALENCFVNQDVPQLDLREPFRDVNGNIQHLARLEKPVETNTKFDNIRYSLEKLVGLTYTAREDLLRTLINPETIKIEDVQYDLLKERNKDALKALEATANTNSYSVGSFTAIGNFHSTNKSANQINAIRNSFWKTNEVTIDRIAMNTDDYTDYTTNTWTANGGPGGITPTREISGVSKLPGIDKVEVIVDPTITKGTFIAFNYENAFRCGQGPKVIDTYVDHDRDAQCYRISDFVEFINVQNNLTKIDRKFATKVTIS